MCWFPDVQMFAVLSTGEIPHKNNLNIVMYTSMLRNIINIPIHTGNTEE